MGLDKISILLDTCALLKRINKYKLKSKSKPWITLGLQTWTTVKSKPLTSSFNKKDPILKEEFALAAKIHKFSLHLLEGN